MKLIRFIISAIVGISMYFVQNYECTKPLKLFVSYLFQLKPFDIPYFTPILAASISYLLLDWIETRMMKCRFKHSVKAQREMRKAMKRRVTRKSRDEDKKMDRYLQSPIEYATETVKGNAVPSFKPDDPAQDVMFNSSVRYIVAITAENPNLWMDPTYCFYMANCYAVSLMNQTNKAIDEANKANKRIKRIVVRNREELEDKIESIEKNIIDLLSDNQHITNFELIRFFMFTEAQKESCENAVFPSLKAAQDLFRTHSFYINKDYMRKRTRSNNWDEFSTVVTRLWSLFGNTAFVGDGIGAQNVLAIRKKEIIPEFLFLYYDNEVEIRSFLDGNPVKVVIKKDTKYSKFINECDYGENVVENDIDKLVSLLASYVQKKDYQDDLTFINNHNMVNNNYAFFDWEFEPVSQKNTCALRFFRN